MTNRVTSCLRVLVLVANAPWILAAGAAEPATVPLSHEAYIWQRSWNNPLREALTLHASQFSGLVPLNAEITWVQKQPRLVNVALDYDALRAANRPIGLALRIGSYPGPFSTNDAIITCIADLASSLITRARFKSLDVKELQLDFDCADSKLDGYRQWVQTIRSRVAPTSVFITALPSWLKQSSFKPLADAAGGFILQVHSLERPVDANSPFTLCNVDAARSAVERAGKFGVPFRVALPTYGYLTAFAADGQFIGLSAEGPSHEWPQDTTIRPVRSQPAEIAALVKTWSSGHPPAMTGIIWYRFPILLDTLNWSWPTLSAVMAGRTPSERLHAEALRPEKGLVKISLVNDGEADLSSRPVIEVRWQQGRLVAADGLRDFAVVDSGPNMVTFKSTTTPGPLPSGERRVIGWLRFNEEVEVAVEIK
jgi:hypothetical protein